MGALWGVYPQITSPKGRKDALFPSGAVVQHLPPGPAALLYPGLGPFFVASSLPGRSWAELPIEGVVLPEGVRSSPLMLCSDPNAPPLSAAHILFSL